jgi:hypothetical protein
MIMKSQIEDWYRSRSRWCSYRIGWRYFPSSCSDSRSNFTTGVQSVRPSRRLNRTAPKGSDDVRRCIQIMDIQINLRCLEDILELTALSRPSLSSDVTCNSQSKDLREDPYLLDQPTCGSKV